MRSPVKLAFLAAAAFIFLSPLAGILYRHYPSPIQIWPMYSATSPMCTMHFSSAEGNDPNFHIETVRLINQGLDRPDFSRFVLRNEAGAGRLLDAYCFMPSTKHRRAIVDLKCFTQGEWKTSSRSGELACKD